MHIAAADGDRAHCCFPRLQKLRDAIQAKAKEFEDVVKIGRTHLQDATPLTVGQEFSGWVAQLERDGARIAMALEDSTISPSAARRSAPGSTRILNLPSAPRKRSPS